MQIGMPSRTILEVRNLRASVEGREILKGIDLEVKPDEFHVLMGPNGSGKSTLAKVLAGSYEFVVRSGSIKFLGKELKKLTPDKRAKLGIFLAFQHPVEIPGVSVFNVLRKAKQASRFTKETPLKTREKLIGYAESLKLSDDFIRRSLNEGFSGGEKKRSEILQMMALAPKLAILDEIDSGLDVDALKIVALSIKRYLELNRQSSVLLITHYARILKYLKPDFVHIMVDGKIIKSGTINLAKTIEKSGYLNIRKEVDDVQRNKKSDRIAG